MWLVNAALRNPYTVWVGMLLVGVVGWLGYTRTPTDILPNLKVPVVVVFASYRGMPAPDMEQSVTAILERALTRCDHLMRIESRSLLGIGIIQLYFRPEIDADIASTQVVTLVNSEMQNLPPGMLPPTILKYDASSIPVGNLVISSSTRDDKYLLDLADHQLRDALTGIEGLASAPVFGGVFRQVQIYVHPRTLEALKMSPMDIARIVNTQSQVIPTGELRIGPQNYYVSSNSMVATPKEFEKIPLFADGRKVVHLGDVADVVDGERWRTNTVRVDGRRAVYMPLLRQAGASAVTVVDNVQAFLPTLYRRGIVPNDVDVEVAFDQSQYVRDALGNLRLEGLGGAVLASLVVLLFLGSMRSMLIVALSIPLAVFAAFAGLYFTGFTLNIMTLGGLALVLGRVVDDSIVDVENTVRHLGLGKTPFRAALDSAREIAVPVLLATLTTVVVFLPLIFLTGTAKYLFTPLAVSATMALFASYFVSRTVSPLFCSRHLRPHGYKERVPVWLAVVLAVPMVVWLAHGAVSRWSPVPLADFPPWARRPLAGFHGAMIRIDGLVFPFLWFALAAVAPLFWIAPAFDRVFEKFAAGYEYALRFCLRRPVVVLLLLAAVGLPAWLALRDTGQELFPEVDSGEFTVHMRATGGPKVEETERQVEEIEKLIGGYKLHAHQLVAETIRAHANRNEEKLERIALATRDVDPDFVESVRRAQEAGDGGFAERFEAAHPHRPFHIPGVVPPEDLEMILSNVGLSSRWSAIYTPNNGPHAAFVRVQLRSGFAGRRRTTVEYVDDLREKLKERFPSNDFFFETGGMIRRILTAGAVAPIEVQVHGRDNEGRRKVAEVLDKLIGELPHVRDTYVPQGMDLPQYRIVVDRTMAARPKLTESDVVRNVIGSLMSSAQLVPNFWIDPTTGNPYYIGVQYPEHAVESRQTLEKIPITPAQGAGKNGAVLRLEDVARIEPTKAPIEVYHQNVNRVSQLLVSAADNDLARVAGEIDDIVKGLPLAYALETLPRDKRHLRDDPDFRATVDTYVRSNDLAERRALGRKIQDRYEILATTLRMPRDTHVTVRGEITMMRESFREMAFILVLAALLIYLLMAAQFKSWLDPVITIVSAPLGLIGVALLLWATGTSLNIQSGMGILMMIGISVSNSVLLVEFANRVRVGEDPAPADPDAPPTAPVARMAAGEAAAQAARVRLRPILMTTLATIVGLLPMAIHMQPGDEMNLPLARAVIGGLAGSTLLTLFVVPVLYTLLKRGAFTPPPG